MTSLLVLPATAFAQDNGSFSNTSSVADNANFDNLDADSEDDETETILITESTRRTTRLFETPVPITSISEDSLLERNITNTLTLEKLVPNLKIQDQRTLGAGAIQFTLRGVGNSNFTEQGDPNVGFHIDGVYLSRPQAAVAFLFDLERLEVLRGPQGTLFGRNSTVGTINVVTAKPDAERVSGAVDGQLGIFNDRMVRATLNVPVFNLENASLAFRGAAFARHRDSFYSLEEDRTLQSLTNGDGNQIYPTNPYRAAFGQPDDEINGAGAINESGVRLSGRFKAFDRLTVDGTYELFRNKSPPSPLTTRRLPYSAILDLPMTMDQTTQGIRGSVEYVQPNIISLKYNVGYTYFDQEATIDLDAGIGLQRDSTLPRFSGPGAPALESQFFYDQPFTNDSYSHELQIRSEWDFPITFVAGLFIFREETRRNLWIDIPAPEQGVILFNQPSRVANSRAGFGEITWNITDKIELKGGLRYSYDRKRDFNGSRSDVFPGGGVGTVADGFGCPLLAAESGLTPEDARAQNFCGINSLQSQFRAPFASFDRVFNNEADFDNVDWAVTLSYTPRQDSVIYAKAASGYKSGGFQDTFYVPRNDDVIFPILQPENLVSFELGYKSTLFDGSLRLAGDLYAMLYTDKQESILVNFGDRFCPFTFGDFTQDGVVDIPLEIIGDPNIPVFLLTRVDANGVLNPTPAELAMCDMRNFNAVEFNIDVVELVPINISDAVTAGAELEWFWQLTENLRFSGFIAINFFNEVGNVDPSGLPIEGEALTDALACADRADGCPNVFSLDGNRLPFAPVFSGAFNVSYDLWLGDSVLTPSLGVNVSSPYFLSIWNVNCYTDLNGREICNNGDRQKAYATLDLNLRYTAPYSAFYLEGYATNVTNTAYATFNRRNSGDGVTSFAFNPRRQVGARLGVRF